MKRILISQNEANNSEDYVVVDGELINDKDDAKRYHEKLNEADKWKKLWKDDFLEFKMNEKDVLIKSHYLDKDSINRSIYYVYYVEKIDDLRNILTHLEKDSQVINRSFDKQKTSSIIEDIFKKKEESEKTKQVFLKRILPILLGAFLAYILFRILK